VQPHHETKTRRTLSHAAVTPGRENNKKQNPEGLSSLLKSHQRCESNPKRNSEEFYSKLQPHQWCENIPKQNPEGFSSELQSHRSDICADSVLWLWTSKFKPFFSGDLINQTRLFFVFFPLFWLFSGRLQAVLFFLSFLVHVFCMLKIGVTGGYGSGKSLVCGILAEKGFAVIDIDSIVFSLYGKEEIAGRVRKIFGSLDRKEIAEQAFSDNAKRKGLEEILHPAAMEALGSELKPLAGERFVFVEASLLFESGFQEFFDFVVAITAKKPVRLERLAAKGISAKEAERRMLAQFTDEERIKKADFVIDNSGSLAETEEQVKPLLEKLEALDG